MGRIFRVALLSGALAISSTATVFAVDTPSPTASPAATPQVSAKSKPVKQVLTQAQKDAIAAAKLAYSNAKTNAQDGFTRALADAQAIRDQALASAGTDKKAQGAARKAFRDFVVVIQTAYKAALLDAKTIFQAALAAAVNLPH